MGDSKLGLLRDPAHALQRFACTTGNAALYSHLIQGGVAIEEAGGNGARQPHVAQPQHLQSALRKGENASQRRLNFLQAMP